MGYREVNIQGVGDLGWLGEAATRVEDLLLLDTSTSVE